MKKLLIAVLLISMGSIVLAQCEPDKSFYPSASVEVNTDWGGIMQVGITGQISRLSFHAGIRTREFVDSITIGKWTRKETKLLPRMEIGYRVVNGIHLNAGFAYNSDIQAVVPDISVTAYKRLGDQIAIFGRGLYDKKFSFGIGLKVLFYRE